MSILKMVSVSLLIMVLFSCVKEKDIFSSNEICMRDVKIGMDSNEVKLLGLGAGVWSEERQNGIVIQQLKIQVASFLLTISFKDNKVDRFSCYPEHDSQWYSKDASSDHDASIIVSEFNNLINHNNRCNSSSDCSLFRAESPFSCWYSVNRDRKQQLILEYSNLRRKVLLNSDPTTCAPLRESECVEGLCQPKGIDFKIHG